MAYSTEDKTLAIATLAANDNRVAETAEMTGVSRRILQHWRDGNFIDGNDVRNAQLKKLDLAQRFESIALRILNSISEEDILSAPLLPRMTTAGIAIDKMRLLREESTSINEHTSRNILSVEEKRARIIEILTGGGDTGDVQLPVSAGDGTPALPSLSQDGDAAELDA
jgi:hypothetical protein